MSKLIVTSFNFREKDLRLFSLLDDSGRPYVFDVPSDKPTLIGNIYVGRVQSIAKEINAAFIEYEPGKKAFYSLEEPKPIFVKQNHPEKGLSIGDELLIEIIKDSFGEKDPVATSDLTFKDDYLLISTGNLLKGVSKKITDSQKRNELKTWLKDKSSNIGIIARTNSKTLSIEKLEEKYNDLYAKYDEVIKKAPYLTPYSILRKQSSDISYLINTLNTNDIEEIVTDKADVYEELLTLEQSIPVRLYKNELPLYKVYSLQTRLEEALAKKVYLKSGGYLYIEPTEALTVIDVNSGKKSSNKNKEENAFEINIEAAREIILQLSLRNISGIIIVDFINLNEEENKKKLLSQFAEFAKSDYIGVQILGLTSLGLCEITRKKTKKPLFSQIFDWQEAFWRVLFYSMPHGEV